MKCRLLYFLLLSIFLFGGSSPINLTPGLTKVLAIETQSHSIADELIIINSSASVRPGEFGFITIQGRPETKYRITTTFKKNKRVVFVRQCRVTGINGQATFNWFVDSETIPGTYSALISGGGKRVNIYHTVHP